MPIFILEISDCYFTFDSNNNSLSKRGKATVANGGVEFAEGSLSGDNFVIKNFIKTPGTGLYVIIDKGNSPKVLGPISRVWQET